MHRRIVVALGAPPASEAVEAHALFQAKASGAPVVLVHAIEPIDGEPDDPEIQAFYARVREQAEDWLEAARARFAEAGVEASVRVEVGKRWERIVEVADEEGADLLVIGSRPTVEGERLRLGSTSHGVFFAARCPLLVVRTPA